MKYGYQVSPRFERVRINPIIKAGNRLFTLSSLEPNFLLYTVWLRGKERPRGSPFCLRWYVACNSNTPYTCWICVRMERLRCCFDPVHILCVYLVSIRNPLNIEARKVGLTRKLTQWRDRWGRVTIKYHSLHPYALSEICCERLVLVLS